MTDDIDRNAASGSVILKVFSGVQSGVEVHLISGEYALGNGPDDDIQFVDVSLLPGHLRLRVAAGRIELAGGSGGATTATGTALAPGDPWREIEPLDVVSAGTTRFALGHPTSRWASIGDAGLAGPARPAEAPAAAPASGFEALAARARAHRLTAPLLALAALLLVGLWFLIGGLSERVGVAGGNRDQELATVREALDRFPFGRGIEARQEVDGTIYVTGYVEAPVERRALVGALDGLGIPARVRLWVLQTLRSEIRSLIESQRVNVTFELAPNGIATLDGVILDKARAARFVGLVQDRVLGLAGVKSQVRTVETLRADVERLAVASQIQPWILLRADGELIEATGAIPVSKVDAWVGFLQSYARRFSRDVALRSFVQLQAPGGGPAPGVARPIVVGAASLDGDAALNVDRLRQGSFQLADVLAGATPAIIAEAQRAEAQRSEARRLEPPRPDTPRAEAPTGEMPRVEASRVETPRVETSRAEISRTEPAPAETRWTEAGRTEPGRMGTGREEAPRTETPRAVERAEAPTGEMPRVEASRVETPRVETSRAEISRTEPAPAETRWTEAGRTEPGRMGTGREEAPRTETPRAVERAEAVERRQTSDAAAVRTAEVRPESPLTTTSRDAPSTPAMSEGPPPRDGAPEGRGAGDDLARQGRDALRRWQAGTLDGEPRERALRLAIERVMVGGSLRPGGQREPPPWYVPVLAGPGVDTRPACWTGAHIRPDDIPATLFWLDLLSASQELTLATLGRDIQVLMLEGALNPTRLAACAESVPTAREAAANSLYLREIRRNASFTRFIVRDLPPFSLDITGVNVVGRRFVLTRAGARMFEGSAPDRSSRLALIGELGIVVQLAAGLAAVIYEPDLAWKIGQ